jgi:PAS domain S-box-containing protein
MESSASITPGGKPAWPARQRPVRDGLLTAAVIFISACIPLIYLWHESDAALDAEMKTSLREAVESSALLIDGDVHSTFTLPEQEFEAPYQSNIARMRRFMNKNPRLVSMVTYVMIEDQVYNVLDVNKPGDANVKGSDDLRSIMEPLDHAEPELMAAFQDGESMVGDVPYTGETGLLLDAYAPFLNRRGELAGVMGVEIRVDDTLARVISLRRAALIGAGLALLISVGMGFGVWNLGSHAQAAQQQAWTALNERNLAETRYHQLFDQAPIGVFYFGQDMRITHCNRCFCEIIGSPEALLVGLDMNQLRDTRLLPAVKSALQGEDGSYFGPYRTTTSNRDLWVELLSGPVRDPSGAVIGGIATVEDITMRHRTEVMSDMEKELLAMITRNEPLSEILTRLVLEMETLMPSSLCSILYLDEEGKHLLRGVAPHLPEEYVALIDRAPVAPLTGSCGTAAYENRMVISSDIQTDPLWESYRELAARFNLRACWSKPIHSSHGGILGTFAIYHQDVFVPSDSEVKLLERAGYIAGIAIERSRHGEELSRERNLLRTLIENLSDVIFIKDRRHQYLAANAAAARFLGVSNEGALLGKTDYDLFPQATASISHRIEERVLAGSPDINQESTIINDAGETTILSFSRMPLKNAHGEMIGLVVIGRNVTDQHHVEEERIKTQKLESLGLLAGGIAHDFNNILTSVLGNVSMIKHSPDGVSPDNTELITEAEQAIFRARELTQQLLTFAKGGLPVKRPANIGQVVSDAARFAVRGSASRLEMTVATDGWVANIDSGQISQVVQNLVLNADQAMPHGGTINISIQNLELKQGNRMALPPGFYVSIAVRDHGVGIPERNRNKIFDPYFSTKPAGNGLGLTTSFSIIKKHGGNITVHSTVGKGSEFTFLLPALPEHKLVETETDGPPSSTQHARILIMDDEEAILKISSRILERSGFQVRVSHHGEEAIMLYKDAFEHGTPFDLVILDLTIPGGMGGKETFEHLREIDPTVKAIVSSGYSMDEIMARHEMFGFIGIVTKPYHRDDLINVINHALKQTA